MTTAIAVGVIRWRRLDAGQSLDGRLSDALAVVRSPADDHEDH